MNRFETGIRVELVSFNGELEAAANVDKNENYWLLIGSRGKIVDDLAKAGIQKDRVLVRFDVSIAQLGLESHNEVPNTLWIRRTDLSILE